MKKLFKRLFLVLLAVIICTTAVFHKRILLMYGIVSKYISLEKEIDSMNQNFSIQPIEKIDYKDVIYKNTNNVPLTLDIYSPIKNIYKKSPVILYVHGGSWVYGDKSLPTALTPVLDTFREQGYTIISTSYELMRDKENFSKQVSDIKDTIRWINKNAEKYSLDTDEIGVFGISSGAHLSMMASYTSNSDFIDSDELKNYPCNVKYLIDFAGPTDLSLIDTTNLNFDLSKIFNSVSNKESTIQKFNPINYVNPYIPETLIIHSKSDNIVPFQSSKKLAEKCQQVKAHSKLISLNSSSHDLSEISSDDIINVSKGLLFFVISNSPLK
ncbi:alpha/beta hydrolase [uncultured Clostridium sp.]|uniref:alpha/beta hydrolase n=1 Tax=uncultured Clostridium sp. TaxID=59620 RepID=UPI0025F89712|nr:alpha/beta hydrolase [uncultured Clostridium sp.]